ncbi:MAG: phage tail sheath family protein [Gammaproteobacteria bacterium]
MVQVTYPGVYIQEIPSGVRTITGVATSIAAFVDSFPRGLLNEAVQCLSYADFEREFGGINVNSPASYGIKQFFQNGGSECWVVRVATIGDPTPTNNAEASSFVIDDIAGTDCFRIRAGRRIRGEIALNPGLWGDNLHIDIDYETSEPDDSFNLVISEILTLNGRRSVTRTETFRNLVLVDGDPNNALAVVNETSRLIQLDRDGMGNTPVPAIRPAPNGTFGGALTAAIVAGNLNFTVQVSGVAVTRAVTLTVPANATYIALRPLLEAAIRNADLTTNLPAADAAERALITGATVRLVGGGPSGAPLHYLVLAGRGGSTFDPAAKLTFVGSSFLELDSSATVVPTEQQYRLTDGQDGTVPVGAPALTGSLAAKTGLYALEDVDLFNILCIPRAAELDATNMQAVYEEANTYVTGRRAFLLVDIPEATATLEAMQTWLAQNDSLRSKNAAVYFPRTFVPDPANGNRLTSIAASGTIAGLYARTDATRGVWKAPAGTDATLQNVQSLAYLLTDLQNGALNPLGVNCLRTFPVYSHICWGARTLDGADQLASEWKYVPIVRLALFIEESLFRGTKWVVFEPNDEPLWAQIRLNVGVFMNGLFRQGAFQGQTPKEAYFVKCDKETTTQADRNLGIVNIAVGFAPLKPAEFVVITIQQIAGDLQA